MEELALNPFNPGGFVDPEFFVGREKQVERVRGLVRSTVGGRVTAGFITGERGIGKSSMARYVQQAVQKHDGVVGCHVPLGVIDDLDGMVAHIWKRLLQQSADRPWYGQVAGFFGDRVKSVGAFGVQLALGPTEEVDIRHTFVQSVHRLVQSLGPELKSLLVILDDVNGMARSRGFAHWIKSTLEELQIVHSDARLCLLLVGLEEQRQRMISEQPSIARVFDPIDIAPWSPEEATDFFRKTFSTLGVDPSKDHLTTLVRFSGGLPVLAHEIGAAVWRSAATPHFTDAEVSRGIAEAADLVGRKFLERQMLQAIRSERYRSILRRIADEKPLGFHRADLMKRLPGREQRVLDAFLRRMKKLGALVEDPESPGGYRFPSLLYAVYFSIEARRTVAGRFSLD